jgi:hypothetical protein
VVKLTTRFTRVYQYISQIGLTFSTEILRPGSSVGIATSYGLDGPGIESWWGRIFPHLSIPALGLNQPPIQLVPGLSGGQKSGQGVKLTPHPLLVPWSRKGRAVPLLPLWAARTVQSFSACTRVRLTLPYSNYVCISRMFFTCYMTSPSQITRITNAIK